MEHHPYPTASGQQQQQQSPYSSTFSQPGLPDFEKQEDTTENWSEELSGGDVGEGDPGAENQDGSRKKRRRPMSVSCELCKQRKVKCDRGQPSCGWCSRNGQLCEYKERKKPGLRAGYGRELEQRLDRLEDIIQSQGRLLQETIQNNNHRMQLSPVGRAMMSFHQPPTQPPQAPQPEPLYIPNPSNYPDPQQLQQSELVGYNPPQRSVTPKMQQSQFSEQNLNDSRHGINSSLQNHSPHVLHSYTEPPLESPTLNVLADPQSSLSSQDHDFPPYDLLYALTDLYFRHINTWCPILHRQTTLDTLFRRPSALDEADRILLHSMVATTLRFSNDERLNGENRQRYHDASKRKVLLYGLENSSVKALQALVILALDLVGSSNGPPGWNLLALITRSVVQLGLAVESSSASVSSHYPSIYTLRAIILPEPQSWIEDESRRRLFWMVYLLDRYATIATAFEFALNENEMDRKLPCRDDILSGNQPVETRWFRSSEREGYSIDKPENLGSFSYYIEVLGILSRVHQFLKQPVDIGTASDVERWQYTYRGLDNRLTAWSASLPPEYGSMARIFSSNGGNKVVNSLWVMLHACYHTTVIRLHSSAAYPTTRSVFFSPSFTAGQRCHSAVENIVALGRYVVNNGMLDKLGPPFAFTLWVAARVLLVHGSTIEHEVSLDIYFLVDTLREMGKHWRVADRYSTILKRVLDEYRDSQQVVAANGERVTPSSVKILADMRRCAYDLDFLISRQPRHSAAKAVSVTPYPPPNELEYLEAFDFFNVPRLPAPASAPGNGPIDPSLQVAQAESSSNHFNITNYTMDASSDWLFKHSSR